VALGVIVGDLTVWLKRDLKDEKVYPGTHVVVGDDGVAKRIPWHEGGTTYGPIGKSKIKKKRRRPVSVSVEPVQKRDPRSRADQLAQSFVDQLQKMEVLLGRPVTTDDLSDQWLRAFGVEFAKRGEIVTPEQLRRVAAVYLNAVTKGAGRDARWSPSQSS